MNKMLINGAWLGGEGAFFKVTSPSDGSDLWQGNSASNLQVTQAVESSRTAQIHWRKIPLSDRVALIRRFAQLLDESREDLAKTISRETGKPLWESATEVSAMTNKAAISIEAQDQRAGISESLVHRAHGVFAVLGPYNFPGHLPNGHIIPALLAGNTVVLKPSEHTPLTAEITLRIWQQAGLPKGVINLLHGGAEVGQALSQADIDGLLFTGSSKTGIALHRAFSGRPECLLALEMGGNNPLIVGNIDNLDLAVWHIITSAFISAGQRCTCARRLILIENETTDKLVNTLIAQLKRLQIGHWKDDVFMGPVINAATAKALRTAEQEMLDCGGRSLLRFENLPQGECYLPPAVIDMTEADQMTDEEWFGPLLQIYRVNDFDTALRAANATRFGLAAGLLSDDQAQQSRFNDEIKAGFIAINKPTTGAPSKLPFGGVGASGNHRPSAYYAADYCAWPQAIVRGEPTNSQRLNLPKGVSQ